jgi:predicted phage replisome organizer
MAEKTKYWIKIEKDFLKSSHIKVIKSMPNGKDYIIFYLALMLESTTTAGHLRFNEIVPYNEEMLSAITDINIDIVRSAVVVFEKLGLIQFLADGTIFLPDVPKRIGKESESAERVRLYREGLQQKALQCNDDVTNCNDNKEKEEEEEKEKEINKQEEIEKEIDTDIDKSISLSEQVGHLYSEICKSYPKLTKLSEKRKIAIKARLKTGFTIEDFKTLFEKAEASLFLKGKNKNNWTATFDWLICDSNMAKVLDGNYDNKKTEKEKQIEERWKPFE